MQAFKNLYRGRIRRRSTSNQIEYRYQRLQHSHNWQFVIFFPNTENNINIGPKCHDILLQANLDTALIFFQQTKIDSFVNTTITAKNVNNCRQLMSIFHHQSTYHTFCSNLLENRCRQPVTIFILCMLPNIGNGSSADNEYRQISTSIRF